MPRRRDIAFGLTALALAPAAARAGGKLGVAPTLIEFGPGRGTQLLIVSNAGSGPLTTQVRLFAWRNDGDREVLTPSDDLIFSPAQFVVPPGGRQIVRLLPKSRPEKTEQAYRLFVDQLPDGERPGAVQFPVRMLVPVFVGPVSGGGGEPALTWSAKADRASGRVVLTARNTGARRVRLAALAWEAGGRATVLDPGLAGYVLAGGEWQRTFPLIGRPPVITVRAKSERGAIAATVPVDYG